MCKHMQVFNFIKFKVKKKVLWCQQIFMKLERTFFFCEVVNKVNLFTK